MTAKLKIILLALVLFASSAAFAQKASDKSQIKLRGKGNRLILTSKGVRRTFDLKEKIDAAKLDDVELLLVSRKESFVYLLVSACGSSKLVPDDKHCGAGEECNLLWLKLDSGWKMSDSKSIRYESCWQPVTSSDGYKISGQTFRMEYSNLIEKKHYKVSYNADQPEAGFTVEESPLEDTGSN